MGVYNLMHTPNHRHAIDSIQMGGLPFEVSGGKLSFDRQEIMRETPTVENYSGVFATIPWVNCNFLSKTGLSVGSMGSTGPVGPQGSIGAIGQIGFTGATGATGADGGIGPSGVAGTNGAAGANGFTGATGFTGASGISITGSIGNTGPTGATGAGGGSISVGEVSGNSFIYKKLNIPVQTSSSSLSEITGLHFELEANKVYGFETFYSWQSNTLTCGLSLLVDYKISPPNISGQGSGFWNSEIITTEVAGTDAWQSKTCFTAAASGSGIHTTASVAKTNWPYTARQQGTFYTAGTGTLRFKFAAEVNGNTVTMNKGSWARIF